MNTVMIKKIDVHHVIEGVHTDECEAIPGWDTVWNPDLKKNIFNDYGLWQCPHCECVTDSESTKMISYETYREWYL